MGMALFLRKHSVEYKICLLGLLAEFNPSENYSNYGNLRSNVCIYDITNQYVINIFIYIAGYIFFLSIYF